MAGLTCLKVNKRTKRSAYLKSIRQFINNFRDRNRTKFKVTDFTAGFFDNSYLTYGRCKAETVFDTYEVEFPSAYAGADFLRKHNICDLDIIISGTQDRLRKPLFDHIIKCEKRREKRKESYKTKVTKIRRF